MLDVAEFQKRAAEEYEPVGSVIEAESNRLARVLTHESDGEIVDTLTYSFREIIRNAVEHSESDSLTYCAQYWPTKNLVEIVVLDKGVGIRKSLSNNPNIGLVSDREAIQLSLMPSISGKFYKGIKRQTGNVWQNSGFGLYMTNRLCRNGGSFFICSGSKGIMLTNDMKFDLDTNYQGTALRLRINLANLLDLKLKLEQFKKEGYEIASKYAKGMPIEASVASMMLSRDFAKQ